MPQASEDRAPSSMTLDALLPAAMLDKAIDVGVAKARMPLTRLIALGVLGGAFIGLGAMFSTVVAAGGTSFGQTRLLSGLAFSLGLVLVVVGGAELFTGNNLLTIAFAERRISVRLLLRNWLVVYVANQLGAVATAALVFATGQYRTAHGVVGLRMLETAEAKASPGLFALFASGVVANALVCLAVWLSYSGRSVVDKVVAIALPVSAFVAGGFEHSIANGYLLPTGWFVVREAPDAFWLDIGRTEGAFGHIDGRGIVSNVGMSTLGNLVGGALLVAAVYWFAYARHRRDAPASDDS
jgi:formate transporter